MNQHLEKIIRDSKDITRQSWVWYKELSRTRQVIVALVIVAILVVLTHFLGGSSVQNEVAASPRTVKLALVSDLSNNDSPLPLLGTITSTSEATIRAEGSGKLTRVYKKLGDYVTAGQIIAEFENSAERAAVLQAEGAYDAAKASRDIARINSGNTSSSLTDAQTSALNAISSAYINMDDAIHVKTDGVYTNPRNQDVRFVMSVPDAGLTLSLEDKRRKIEAMLNAREAINRTLTINNDLVAELTTVQSEEQTIKSYLDDLATAYSKALVDNNFSQSQIDAGKASVGLARSTISTTISSTVAARTALNASLTAQAVAGKTSGNTNSTVTSADAQVKQAEGAYDAALSRLEKTIIRSPISGTLNSLSISTGDFISAFTQVGVVSNNGALEVVAYVTEDDAKRVTVGNNVAIADGIKGIVTRVAPAIDPVTKKIEVRIGITGDTTSLVNGQSVSISILRSGTHATTPVKATGPIMVPIAALKITPQGAFMFTVDENNKLVAHEVAMGALMGDQVGIVSGITPDMNIVTDARGLRDGMEVVVQK